MKKRFVFIDRDGTINVNLPFPNVNRPDKLRLLPRTAQGIRALNSLGLMVVVVTNQAGINNPENDLSGDIFDKVTRRLGSMIKEAAGAHIDDTLVCPHQRSEECACRKPGTGLFEMAARKYHIDDLGDCFIIGDRDDDISAGNALGMTTVLVRTGHGERTERELSGTDGEPDHVADGLYEAAMIIKRTLTDETSG